MNYCKPYKHIPNTLKAHRLAKGLTQDEVAYKLNLKNNTLISRWEKGISFPNIISIIKLCDLYQVSFQELFGNLIAKFVKKKDANKMGKDGISYNN